MVTSRGFDPVTSLHVSALLISQYVTLYLSTRSALLAGGSHVITTAELSENTLGVTLTLVTTGMSPGTPVTFGAAVVVVVAVILTNNEII